MNLLYFDSFQSLGIQHATRREVVPVLQKRILENQRICNAVLGPDAIQQITPEDAAARAKAMAKDMDLSKVRLCFQAYLKDSSGRFTHALPPVFSNVIYDSRKYLLTCETVISTVQ